MILEDDVSQNDILLLKKGISLNDYLIDKLINFGIKEIPVNITNWNKNIAQTELVDYDLIKNQSALIFHKDIKEILKIVQILPKAGFKEQNIFATSSKELLDKYIMKKNLLYIFIDKTLFNKETADQIAQLLPKQQINIFVLGAETFKEIANLKEVKNFNNSINIKILQKPLDSGYIKALINLCPSGKFKQLLEKSEDFNQIYQSN
jgi:hypothetical protein